MKALRDKSEGRMLKNIKGYNRTAESIKTIEREVRAVMRELCVRDRSSRERAAEEMTLQRPSSFLGISFMAVIAVFFSLILVFPYIADAASMGPNSPTTAANDASVGTVGWSNTGNVFTSDNGYATVALGVSQVSNYLVASGLNFAVPSGATINGIAASIERKEGNAYYVSIRDSSVKLVKNGTITGTEHAGGAVWSSTEAVVNYGSSADIWGTTWTSAEINASTFGIAISVMGIGRTGQAGAETASIDQVTVTVYYTPIGGCVPSAATVVLDPSSQTISTDGGSKAYTLTIINNDTGACADETFNLSKTDSGDTAKMSSVILPASVVLPAGGSTSVPMLTVTAVSGQTTGSLTSYVTATGTTHSAVNSNSVITTLGIASCVRNAPTVSLAPATRTITTNGGTALYTLTITNNDSPICASETFNLTKNDNNSTNFDPSTLSVASVSLAPGASSSTITLTAHAKAGQTSGTNMSSVTAASTNHANVTSTDVMTTLNVCTTSNPTLVLTPSSNTISTDGGYADYTLTITNNDSSACSAITFSFIGPYDTDAGVNFVVPSTISQNSVTLSPGGSSNSITVRVRAKAGAINGVNSTYVRASRPGQAMNFPVSNTVTTTISAPACTRTQPTMIFSAPTAKTITTNGGSVSYPTLTITNNDINCPDESFSLTTSDTGDTAKMSSSVSPTPISLASGANTTVTLTVTAVSGQTTGSLTSSVTAASANHANKTSNNVTTSLNVSACTNNTPILIISPASQAITPGGSVEYKVTVKNTDTSVCSASTFNLSVVSDTNSTNFTTPSTLDTASLVLAPGQIGSTALTVNSKTTAPNGAANDTTVGLGATGHTPPANVTVRTTVAPISPLNHNSINTGSAKWPADGGWGVPGTKYGEFTCLTCHTPGDTTNIKKIKELITAPNGAFPGSAVNFQTTTTPNGFGDDSDLHATSDKVCETCHSQNKYHNFDTANNTGGSAHNNNTDCVTCHKHTSAFKASCAACHGNPPVDLATLVFNPPSGTGSATAGAHASHVAKNISCDSCHFDSVGTGAEHNNGLKVTLGFSLFNAAIQAGTYNGQAAVVYNSSQAGTLVSSGGLKTCSNIYCHGSTMAPNGGTNTTPTWDVSATGACGTCHGATTASPPTLGLHVKHAGSYGSYWGKEYACTLCHTLAANQHVNNKSEIVFSSDARVTGASYSGTDTMLDAYGNCSSVYCHSNVQTSPPGGAVTYKTVNWGDLQTFKCNVCHEGPAAHTTFPADFTSGNTTGSHSKHGTYSIYCGTCHASDVTQDPADIATNGRCNVCHALDKHADHAINVNIVNKYGGTYSGDTTPGNAYGNCANTYCHSAGTSVSTGIIPANTTTNWGTGVLACSSCHSGGTATGPTYASGSPKTNSHNKHVVGNSYKCVDCHSATVDSANTIISTTNHVNKIYNVSGARITSYTFATDGGTCATACHGTGTPQWGGTVNCGDCHAANNTLANSHSKHYETATTAADRSAANNSTAGQYRFNCGVCHYNAPHATGPVNGNRTAQVAFDGTIGSGTYTEGGVSSNDPVTGFNYTNSTCSTSYCHGNYPGSGKNATATWGTAASGACGTCHEATNTITPASSLHRRHASSNSSTGVLSDRGYACTLCHQGIVGGTGPAAYTIGDKAKHVNKLVDWKFDTSDTRVSASSQYSIATGTAAPSDGTTPRAYGTCSNVYCHSIVQSSAGGALTPNTADYSTVTWGASVTVTCGGCHKQDGSHFAGAVMDSGSHTKHLSYSFTAAGNWMKCELCHSYGVPDITVGECASCHPTGEKTKHVNGLVDVNFYTAFVGASGAYNGTAAPGDGFSNCANTYCHSAGTSVSTGIIPANTTTNWGTGVLACDSCHTGGTVSGPTYSTGSPKTNSHNKHVVGNSYKCVDCHSATVNSANTIISTTNHVNKVYNVAGAKITTYNFATDGGTCATACHGAATPKWGGPSLACNACHSASNILAGKHSKHYGVATVAVTTDRTAASNTSAGMTYEYSCAVCHNPGTTNHAGGVVSTNQAAEVSFDSTIAISGTYTAAGALAGTDVGMAWTAGTCTVTYCHSQGTSTTTPFGGAANTTPTWATAQTLTCEGCHNFNAAATNKMATGKHTQHMNNVAVLGTNIACQACHNTTTSDSTTITNTANHANKVKDVSMTTVGGGTWTSGTATCSSTYCHSTGQATPAYVNPGTWTAGAALGCNGCHGTGNGYGSPDYASGGAGTPTANSHSAHTASAVDCTKCHTDTVTVAGTAIKAASVLHTNQTRNVNFAAAYDTNAGTNSDNYNTGTKACSAISCHGAGAPIWGGPSLACNACHSASNILAGKHSKHYGVATVAVTADKTASNTSAGTTYEYSCGVCHNPGTTSHAGGVVSANQAAEVSFDPLIALSGTYTAAGALAGTDVGMAWTAGTCTVTYCHSQGTSTTTPFGGAANTTPTWATAQTLTCEGCHNFNAAATNKMATGKHTQHMNNVAVLGTNIACQACHNTTTSDSTTITNTANHANKVKDVSMTTVGGGTWTSGTATCSSTYCHSTGQATPAYVNPGTWTAGAALGCNGCHGTGNGYGSPDYASGGAGTPTANSHSAHTASAVDCTKCHTDTVTVAGTAIKAASVLHTNQTRNVNFAAAYDTNAGTNSDNYNTGTKACSAISCHGAGAPVWGSQTTDATCVKCHGVKTTTTAQYTADTKRAAPGFKTSGLTGVDTGGNNGDPLTNGVSADPQVGAHNAHLLASNNYSSTVACTECHKVPASIGDPAAPNHMNGSATLDWGALATTGSSVPSYNSGTDTCNTNYCHGNKQTGGVDKAPEWNQTNYLNGVFSNAVGGDCTKCHASPPATLTHTGITTLAQCNGCHSHVAATGTSFSDKTKHINGIVEGGACNSCHDYDTTGGGSSWGKLAKSVEGYGSHAKHIEHIKLRTGAVLNPITDTFGIGAAASVCGTCHTNSAANHEAGLGAGAGGTRVMNFGEGTYKTGGATGFSFLFDPSAPGTNPPTYNGVSGTSSSANLKSCSAVGCHFTTTPVWSSY